MIIASFNINGIKARINALEAWLKERDPDVALLQEIKSIDENFPREFFEDMGYIVETFGQKSFNGVAILSKYPLEDVTRGLPSYGLDDADEQARYIEATVVGDHKAIRLCNLYLPNGNPVYNGDNPNEFDVKFTYKLTWMQRLINRAKELKSLEMPFLMAGDYNIIPSPMDAANPKRWTGDAAFRAESHALYRELMNEGFTEAFRTRNPDGNHFTFWDYQAGAWNKNDGIRIDHFLLNPYAADLLSDVQIDKDIRGREKPSDHVPIWVDMDI
ncbi:MAG: exodeoxyribonuclease III [Halocynthiibacter sp.]